MAPDGDRRPKRATPVIGWCGGGALNHSYDIAKSREANHRGIEVSFTRLSLNLADTAIGEVDAGQPFVHALDPV
jgi:hypothetical protein